MKIFYALSTFLLLTLQAKSQDRNPGGDSAPTVVKFYPNPATSVITFDFQRGYDKNYNLQIFNLIGKKVEEITNITPKTTVNLNDFYRGIYIFQLKDKNGKVIDSGKFQVSK
ncbi:MULTISPECIES: T9SS type A sorting domain-containing protein [Niastella]|uniref:T9SS type A sorting domain-containing protein n=1 Tax=Niastella soli TaxID=2821487 RepID=A0ABS3YM27_9BACT|nr:T9SS type A sorting domain-containing protein [Niastella soli]MBO9198952.1 T9SS type A sorting domain-containing protein [Niastella soli]